MATVNSFDNVEVLEVGVSGPGGANRLFVVSGVALIDFGGTGDDWNRDDLIFIVPTEGTTVPVERGGPALNVGEFQDSVVSAYPATIESRGGETVGWGVDTVDTIVTGGNNVQVTARVVVRNSNGTLLRMGFQVNILSTV